LLGLGAYWTQAVPPDFSLASAYSLDRLPPPAQRALFERMVPESGRALWETLNWWLDPFMTTQLSPGRISAPVLVAVGSDDRIHPPATVRQTAASLGAEHRVFEQMSHWLIGEPGYETVAGACLDWIAGGRRAAA
jgi:pimeloyl-ACP methyl ester carboxylesterase